MWCAKLDTSLVCCHDISKHAGYKQQFKYWFEMLEELGILPPEYPNLQDELAQRVWKVCIAFLKVVGQAGSQHIIPIDYTIDY